MMGNWHGYFGAENLALSAAQRATLVTALQALGPSSDPQPARLNHWRVRLDGNAAIFEAAFDENNLTIAVFKARLGVILSVDPVTIDHVTAYRNWGEQSTPVATFSRSGTDYLRMALFGGIEATWEQSRLATLGYLAVNLAEWEEAMLP